MNVCAKNDIFLKKNFSFYLAKKSLTLTTSSRVISNSQITNKQAKFISLELREGLLAQSSFVYIQMVNTREKAKFLPYFNFQHISFQLTYQRLIPLFH